MTFASPLYFLLLILLIPYIVWYIWRNRKSEPVVVVSSLDAFKKYPRSFREYLIHVPFLLSIISFSAAVIALARPQSQNDWKEENIEGIDIMLCMDVSTSMLAEDLQPNRIIAARDVAMDFIKGRPNDNIGLTIFAGEAYTQCPMTTDHSVLLNILDKLDCDMAANGILEDGTAIGMGITNAVSRLKDSQAKSKVVIMLTDGSNNRGEITPADAAFMAKEFGIRVYTIGVGSKGKARYPYYVAGHKQYIMVDADIDEPTLQNIAQTTDAIYYRATSDQSLKDVYHEIDKLEKSKLLVSKFNTKAEQFMPFLIVALIALVLELLIRLTVIRKLP